MRRHIAQDRSERTNLQRIVRRDCYVMLFARCASHSRQGGRNRNDANQAGIAETASCGLGKRQKGK
jgi:hypothetical protein